VGTKKEFPRLAWKSPEEMSGRQQVPQKKIRRPFKNENKKEGKGKNRGGVKDG